MTAETDQKSSIDDALAEDIPTKTDSPVGMMKLQASVEGARAEMRAFRGELLSELDDIRKTLARMEANYKMLHGEFKTQFDALDARMTRLEHTSRKTAPSIKKTRPKR